ncbi:hypothetical protein P5V15_011217 [Pogonomyrmex californicus]
MRRFDLLGVSWECPCCGGGAGGGGGGDGGDDCGDRGGSRSLLSCSHSSSPPGLLRWRSLTRKYQRSLLPYRRHCNETGRRWVSVTITKTNLR